MDRKKLDAWQKAPVKIVSEAIYHAEKQNEEDNLISFLLLDVGAEMLLKTYLGLPKHITGSITPEDERYNIIRKGFHGVIEGVKNSRQGISAKELARVEFFHGLRNKLYHQGNGLTVQRSHLDEYIAIIKSLFKQLLKVDIDEQLSSTTLTKDEAERIAELREEIDSLLELSQTKSNTLKTLCSLIVEKIASQLLLPSFAREFEVLRDRAYSEEGFSISKGEVTSYKTLPNDTSMRMEILGWFEELIMPIIKTSPYFDTLQKKIKVGNKLHIDSLSSHLGIKNVEVVRHEVPVILSIIFDDFFNLDDFYFNIVEIIVFGDIDFQWQWNFMCFTLKDIYPMQYNESELEYWISTLDTCNSQNRKLDDFIKQANYWLENYDRLK
ncbi:hypothetical protein H5087_09925 [Pseudoalteromonas sp. SR43-7]|uniref:hypothetical protein n=1 Tax=Pseudoalteromonas sp. SR43-7 TaxID=2760939 RepID=UPI0015FBCC7F|nr:hypothetical protein [Pseudoalteromonas sp. SR43-7]MBB1329667.1 hypothetical protein [Pseudoalteromonas sp. SR43-7]